MEKNVLQSLKGGGSLMVPCGKNVISQQVQMYEMECRKWKYVSSLHTFSGYFFNGWHSCYQHH